MGALDTELDYVQNPALGAILVWQFAAGYEAAGEGAKAVPIPLSFVILALLLNGEMQSEITGTQAASGLRKLIEKLTDSKSSKGDLVLDVHTRSVDMRDLTLASIRIASASKFIFVDRENGTIVSLSNSEPTANVPNSLRPIVRNARKLGRWLGELSLFEVASILRIAF